VRQCIRCLANMHGNRLCWPSFDVETLAGIFRQVREMEAAFGQVDMGAPSLTELPFPLRPGEFINERSRVPGTAVNTGVPIVIFVEDLDSISGNSTRKEIAASSGRRKCHLSS